MEGVPVPMGAVGRRDVELEEPSAGLPSVLEELMPVLMGALDETGVGNG
jgi:hypothetical protein